MSGAADRLQRQLQERIARKQFDAALLSARKYAQLEPENPDAHHWEGYCLMRLRRPGDAEAPLRRALALDPGHAESLSLLGRCLIGQGRHRDALDAARSAEELASGNPEVWDAIGVVYGQLHEYAEAVRVFRRVRELRPGSARNLFNLASMLNFCHETAEAETMYREALQLDPGRHLSYWTLSQLKKQSAQDNNIAWLREQLDRNAADPSARLYINLALAKELEDLGEYAESFSRLETGMSLKRQSLHYELAQDRRFFDTIRESFSPGFCKTPVQGCDSREPIFILGMPRTGTTLLEQIVGAHSEVFAAGELQNFFAAWVAQARERLQKVSPLATMALGPTLDFARLGEDYVRSTRPRTGHTARFIDKMPNNFLYLGAIALALPRAKILHMVRDPLDTCYANYKQLFGRNACPYSYTQEELAGYYLLYRELMAHWEQCFPGRICTVSYEALVGDPEGEARRVVEFRGRDRKPDCLQYHRQKRAVGTASTAQVREPIYRTSVGKWHHLREQLAPTRRVLAGAGIAAG